MHAWTVEGMPVPGKHSSRPVGHARALMFAVHQHPLRRWYSGVAVLVVVLLLVMSIGVLFGRTTGAGYPIIVEPRVPAFPVGGLAPADPSPPFPGPSFLVTGTPSSQNVPSPVETATGTATPSRRVPPKSRPTSPPRRTPTPRPTTAPSRGADLTARYIVYTSWDEGFVVGIEVTNHSRRALPWSVKVIHDRSDGVRVKELWNADLKQGGATTNVFTGGDLAPGATLTFGFKATKWVTRPVRPTTCVVGRTPCRIA